MRRDTAFVRRAESTISVLALTATIFVGCAPDAPGPTSSAPATLPGSASSPSAARVEHAIQVRKLLGLPADHRFVEFLFSDDAAVERGERSPYGIPLTAPEFQALGTQQAAVDATIAIIERYAATVPEAWAGLYIDTDIREVVALFAGSMADHEAALEPLLSANAPLRLKEVEWSLLELERFAETVRSDLDWLTDVDATFRGMGVDEVGNRVRLRVRSTRADIEELILAHYGGSPMLTVEVDPRAEWTGGRGTLVVIAEYEDGSRVKNHECSLVPDDPAAWGEDVRVTGDTGRCTFQNVGATTVSVLLTREADRQLVAGEKATVLEGQTVTVRITIHSAPRQPPE